MISTLEKNEIIPLPQGQRKFFGLIVNRNAGKAKSDYNREYFEEILGDQGIIKETSTLEDVERALNEFKSHSIEMIFIYGGDGTHQKVLSMILRSKWVIPYVVPLRGGTMNMLVKDVGLDMSPKKMIKIMKEAYIKYDRNIPYIEKAVLKIRINKMKTVYGFYLANGAIFKILEQYYKKPASLMNAINVFLNSLLGLAIPFHPFHKFFKFYSCQIWNNGEKLNQEQYLSVMIGTLNKLIFKMRPFLKKAEKMNQFQVIAYACNLGQVVINFPLLASGMKVNHPDIISLTPRKLEMVCDSGFSLDGELYIIKDPFEIEVEIGGYLNIPILKE